MTLSSRKLGAISLFIQFTAIILYLLLLLHQHKVANDSLGAHLLAVSVRTTLVGTVVGLIGIFVDKRKALSLVSLLITLPVLLLMAGWQGIW